MDVKFISTTSDRLPDLPIVSGQLIYLSDEIGTYYDIAGHRNFISGFRLVSELPNTGHENVLYGIINDSGVVDAYIWDPDNSEFVMLSGYAATADRLGLVMPDGETITIDENGVISVASISSIDAEDVTFDNTTSGLSSTNVQAAIDEVVTDLGDKVNTSSLGVAGGVAELDSTGKVPVAQLPTLGATYSFADGTNSFTVTPSDGQAQVVNVTPSIQDNITGSGTSGSLTKFNDTNTVTDGPALSSAISTQTQDTKFLREDGQWSAPSYTSATSDTTYTFTDGTNGFTVTPSNGSAQTVNVTPSITDNITGSGTSGNIAKFSGANTVTDGPAFGSDTTKYLRNDGTWEQPDAATVNGLRLSLVTS